MWPLEPEVRLSSYFFEQALIVLLATAVSFLIVRSERRALLRIFVVYLLSFICRILATFAATQSFPNTARVFAFLVLLFQGIALINLGAILLFSLVLRAVRVEAPRILRDLALAFSYVILTFYLFSHYKVDITGIIATSAVVTAVIGLSLQDVLTNVMGGIALQVDDSVAPGDWIRFGEINGIVREIGWRRMTVETRNGDRQVIPNSLLMKNPVMIQGKRWGGATQQRRWIYFNVDYRHSPTAIIDAVTEALNREPIERVASEPKPQVILLELQDAWARYAARYWLTDLAIDDPTDSTIRTRIYFALRRIRVPFSIPSTNVFVQRGGPPSLERAMDTRIADLKHVAIFSTLTVEELHQIAEGLIYAPFLPGEAILIQGHAVHHLYILTRGRVEVRLSVENGSPQDPKVPTAAQSPAWTVVATLEAPNFFGEGGMLTGEPRRATIVALTEVDCWRLEKEPFERILRARPQIADEISKVLARRNMELSEIRELSEEARHSKLQSEHKSLRERIHRFFGI